jgi:ketosteroid isomerase-like protein
MFYTACTFSSSSFPETHIRIVHTARPLAAPRSRSWIFGPLVAVFALGTLAVGGRGTSAASVRDPASPTPAPTLTPTQQRADQLVRAFYDAYNRRDIPAILAFLPAKLRYDDCDYAHHKDVYMHTKAQVRKWLRERFREHDRFVVEGPLISDTGPGKVGVVGPVTRFNDAVDPLVARGLVPSDSNGLGKDVIRANGKFELVDLAQYGYCLAGTHPFGSKPAKERALVHAFLDAYARQDVAGVLAVLTDDVVYADCGLPRGTVVSLSGKPAVETWIRARFAEGDRLVQPRTLLTSWLSQPPDTPTTLAVETGRSNQVLGTTVQPLTVRIVPTADVTRIRMWQVWSSCSTP